MKRLLFIFFIIGITFQLHADTCTYGIPAIYAPWRENYYNAFLKNELNQEGCPFCPQIAEPNNAIYYVLKRTQYNVVMMNAFPYSRGHLLIIPYQHTGNLDELSPETRTEIMELANECCIKLKKTLNCSGFNIGFNIGPVSGASVIDHLHFHIVPRFPECYSFMHTIGQTFVICFNLERVYQELLPLFNS